jgi:hypothetical protein
MKRPSLILLFSLLILAGIYSCGRRTVTLRSFPLNSAEGVIGHEHVIFDEGISADGRGSLRIEAPGPISVPLFNITSLRIDNARLVYTAEVQTERVFGQVYLEMIGYLPRQGEVITRGQERLQTGTTGWKEQRTTLDLPQDERPDSVKLNIVINGRGTAWIDDIKLLREPLRR